MSKQRSKKSLENDTKLATKQSLVQPTVEDEEEVIEVDYLELPV